MNRMVSERVDITCHTCGKVFKVHPYRATSAKYCSKKCSDVGLKRGKLFTCEECGNEFYRYPSKYKQPNRWCSQKCVGLYYKQAGSATTTHGMSYRPEYRIWSHIKDRCNNPKSNAYKSYGGRGIKVCDEWAEDFMVFYKDMGARPSSKHSVERIDVNGNYEPGNCRWATFDEQALNKQDSTYIEINGVRKHLVEWSRDTGINVETLRDRVIKGVVGEELIKPVANNDTRLCKRGHLIAENPYIIKNKRECRQCVRIRYREYMERKKARLTRPHH